MTDRTTVADKLEELERQLEEIERRALEIEGDSDSPLRVAAADRWWAKADRLAEKIAALRTRSQEASR